MSIMPVRWDDHPVVDRDARGVKRRRGATAVLAMLIVGAAAALGAVLWPDSRKDREDRAIKACETAIEQVAPTADAKVWQESAFGVDGPDKDHLTVRGSFYTGSTSAQTFTCVVDHKVVTGVQLGSS
jgi:hypothetical protein